VLDGTFLVLALFDVLPELFHHCAVRRDTALVVSALSGVPEQQQSLLLLPDMLLPPDRGVYLVLLVDCGVVANVRF
jgi:hypothetical protein